MISDKTTSELAVSYPPYSKHPDSVRAMMIDMLIALSPVVVWGVFAFGVRALAVILISTASSVACEAVFCAASKRTMTVGDLSAVVTGLMLALLLPVGVPLYVPALGAVFAITVVKCAFGGLGCNILNPALTGYVFLKLIFPSDLAIANDPLLTLKAGLLPDVPLYDMIVGNIPGSIGEVSKLLILAGGVYLLIRGTIDWRVPVVFIGVVTLSTLFFSQNPNSLTFMEYELLSGTLFFTAIYAATDPVTTPVKKLGRVIYAACCGLLTVTLRYYGADPDGTVIAVLTMNLLSGVIDRLMSRKRRVNVDE